MGTGRREGAGGRAQAWHLAPLLKQLGTQSWPVPVPLFCCPRSSRGAPCPHPAGAAVTIHPATRESRTKVQIYETMEQSASQMYVPLLTAAMSVAGMQGAARPTILLPLWFPVLVTWDNVDIFKHLCEAFINVHTCTHTRAIHAITHTHVLNNPWDDIVVLHCFPPFTTILRAVPLTALQQETILVLTTKSLCHMTSYST